MTEVAARNRLGNGERGLFPTDIRSTRPSMLTDQSIEAELSYAYLHAVATRAGFSCIPTLTGTWMMWE
jgi:hypothetical protein